MLALVLLFALVAVVFGVSYYWDHRGAQRAAEPHGASRRMRLSLLTRSTAYLGSALIMVGAVVGIGQRWNEVSDWDHVTVFASGGVILLLVGLGLVLFAEQASGRLLGILWFLAIACAAAATGVAAHDVYGGSAAVTALTVGVAITSCSAVLWLARRREPELLALFIGLTTTVCGAILTASGAAAPWLAFALGLWVIGLGWTVIGFRYPEPLWSTVPLAAALALAAPSLAVWGHGWVYAIGAATAVAAIAASVPLRSPLLLAGGTVALFGYLTAVVVRYFQSSIGLPATLTIAGAVLLALAILTVPLSRLARRGDQPAPADMAEVADEPSEPPAPPVLSKPKGLSEPAGLDEPTELPRAS